jgi:hypothetical protein
MADTTIAQRALGAEIRAIEAGRIARAQDDGSFLVHSELGDANYRITYFGDVSGIIRFRCSCPWGERHPDVDVGCKHLAAAGRSLVRRELAVQDLAGRFLVAGWTAPEPLVLDDPVDVFARLA